MNQRFLQLRKELKLSQAEFGERIGISGPAVSKIESGINTPSESTLKLICATYNVNYQWLTEGKQPMYLVSEGEELITKYAPNALEHMKTAIRTLSELSDSDWIAVRSLMEDMMTAVDRMRSDKEQ